MHAYFYTDIEERLVLDTASHPRPVSTKAKWQSELRTPETADTDPAILAAVTATENKCD